MKRNLKGHSKVEPRTEGLWPKSLFTQDGPSPSPSGARAGRRKLENYWQFANDLALQAGRLLLAHYLKPHRLSWKLKTDYKNEVDDLSERFIRGKIIKNFPDHNIYSEEQSRRNRNSSYTWVFDPLSGTVNYTSGINDHFTVSIALLKDRSGPVLGVINAPKKESLYSAFVRKGTFLNGRQVKVSSTSQISKALVGVDFGKRKRQTVLPYLQKLLQPNGITYPVTSGCFTMLMCQVAEGVLDAYLGCELDPWDMAAAVVILKEAGAKVTNLRGQAWQISDRSILAANPVLHQRLLKFLSI